MHAKSHERQSISILFFWGGDSLIVFSLSRDLNSSEYPYKEKLYTHELNSPDREKVCPHKLGSPYRGK